MPELQVAETFDSDTDNFGNEDDIDEGTQERTRQVVSTPSKQLVSELEYDNDDTFDQ